ncbi:hypothetical protein [Nocardioides sp.]|nr:hypothetical protein [Nocardioides sp.]MCW2736801.1 hypothetical protein [Nocardioides sp.]
MSVRVGINGMGRVGRALLRRTAQGADLTRLVGGSLDSYAGES